MADTEQKTEGAAAATTSEDNFANLLKKSFRPATEEKGWNKTTYEVQPTGWFSIYENPWTNPTDTGKLPAGAPADAAPSDLSRAGDGGPLE